MNLYLDDLIDNNMPVASLADAYAAYATTSDAVEDVEEVITIIPSGSQTTNVLEKEVESLEQQALKLHFMQELVEAAEKTNRNLPKKNNETEAETDADKTSIRLYSRTKINEIIHLLQHPPTKADSKEIINRYYYIRKQFYVTKSEPVQLAKKDKAEREVPRIVVAQEDIFDICMTVHRNCGYQGVQGMSKEEAYNGLEIINIPAESKKKIKSIKDLYNVLTAEQRMKFVDLYVEEEEEEDKEVVLTKMHKSLRKLVNKSPEQYDQYEDDEEDDDEEINDLAEALNSTFNEKVEEVNEKVRKIGEVREKAVEKIKDQAQSMLNRNKKAISALNVDDVVLFRVDDVDLGAADAPNIMCIILEKNNNMFKLGHRGGILKEWYPFNVLNKVPLEVGMIHMTREDVDLNKQISVREAVRHASIATGQGFKACNCLTGSCGKGTKCSCYRDGVKCNSRCHKGKENKNCKMKSDRKNE